MTLSLPRVVNVKNIQLVKIKPLSLEKENVLLRHNQILSYCVGVKKSYNGTDINSQNESSFDSETFQNLALNLIVFINKQAR